MFKQKMMHFHNSYYSEGLDYVFSLSAVSLIIQEDPLYFPNASIGMI